ncbi:3e0d3e0b-be38-426a-90b7-b03667cf095f [Thermothielavioides terrestris]|uniref:3e0d3e0b-be38-426a-90b7-b03667cf095f n=1 Tax=Thermothielavioides terrestris TaxID=2587410 RepID=A0A446BIU2_9PEZI|nr:3e0d3e0b-be38-426a-90b7-b03667cf095f [Thermothielavioides terrestris]
MISQTLSGLVIRRSEAIPGVAHPKLPSISQLDLVPSPPPSPGRDQGDHCFQNHQLTMPTKDHSTTTPTTPNPPAPSPAPAGKEKAKAKEKEKRNNQPYTFEQEAFVIYHRVELDLPWDRVREAFMARWPAPDRSVSGLECAYYRTNGRLPATTPDGLLVLVDPEAEAAGMGREEKGFGGEGLGWAQRRKGVCERAGEGLVEEEEEEEEKNKGKEAAGDGGGGAGQYLYYRGVAYRTRAVKCRRAKISLMERFPEELVDERNDWVRHEHRVMARDIAERRRRQREEFLASKARKCYQSMVYF